MKKWLSLILATVMLLTLAVSAEALVFTEDVTDEDGNVIQSGGVIIDNPYAVLYSEFFTDGKYPDDFAGVWVEDGKPMYVFALVEGTDASKYEAVLGDYVGQYRFEYMPYSYNTLIHMRDVVYERLKDIMSGAGVYEMENRIRFDVWVDEAEENGRIAQAMLDVKNEENLPDGIENAFVIEYGIMYATAEEDADLDNEPIPLGTFTVLHSLYNRGMANLEMYLMREGDGDWSNIFCVYMDDSLDGDEWVPSCQVTSDGSADGDAAKKLFETTREIKPGTTVALYADPTAPEPFYTYSESEGYESIFRRTISKMSFGSLWRDPDPEHIASVYSQLNECVIYAQDRRVQFEYEVVDGEIFVTRVEHESFENEIKWLNGLWVLYSEQNGDNLTLVLGAFRESSLETVAYLASAENWKSYVPNVGDLVSVLPSVNVFAPTGQFRIEDLKIENSDEFDMDKELDKGQVIDRLNERLMSESARGPMFTLTSAGAVKRLSETPAPSAPATGVTLAVLPMTTALAALAISKKRR